MRFQIPDNDPDVAAELITANDAKLVEVAGNLVREILNGDPAVPRIGAMLALLNEVLARSESGR